MPSGVYTCKVCPSEHEAFVTPADEIGIALMEFHFQDKHPEEYSHYLSSRWSLLEQDPDEIP